jgi:cytochrome c5
MMPIASWAPVWVLMLLLGIAGCDSDRSESQTPAPGDEIARAETDAESAMQKWTRSCALCHVAGEGGAPVVGDVAAWAPRLANGKDVLLKNAIEGINNMPPLGYCMSCEREDFEIIISFMIGEDV